ncbi:MAG: NTP transferase domain-containing protein [Acidimicrobiia bacterium]
MATIGLVPAAGLGTRLGLTAGSKEAQPIGGRPVIEYLLDRMERASVDGVRVVVRPEKDDVAAIARRRGAEVVVGRPASATASFALAAEGLGVSDTVLFGFPDTIWTPIDGFRPIRAVVESGEPLALGIFDTPYAARSDVAVLGSDGRVARIDVKPEAPAADVVWACGGAMGSRFRELTAGMELGIALSRAASHRSIAAVRLGRVIDVGTPEAFAAAEGDRVLEPD